MRTAKALLAVFAAAAAVPAQQSPRGAWAGLVRDAAGKRVAGAAVTLVSRPVPGRPDLGVTDELRATSGDDGVCRAELLPGRAYSGFATFRDAGGVEQRTAVVDGLLPGPVQELVAIAPQVVRRLRLDGLAAWQGPLSCTLFTEGENPLVRPLPIGGDGAAELPALPGTWCSIDVRTAAGLVVGAFHVDLGGKEEIAVLAVPPPQRLAVLVVDPKGAPVAGARVLHALGYHHRDLQVEIGRTGADGTVAADVPAANAMYVGESSRVFVLLVEAEGRARTVAWCDWTKLPAEGVKVTLRDGVELKGRLVANDAAALRGFTVLPDCYAMGNDAESTGAGVSLPRVPLDADGRFTFHSLHSQYDFRLLLVADPAVARAAGLRLRADVAVAPVLWLAVGDPPFATPHDLGDLKLDEVLVATIEVKDHGGRPVPGARLAVTTRSLYNSPIQYACDRIGRLQFTLPRGTFRVGAWSPNGGGIATRLVTVPAPAEDPPLEPFVMELAATRTVRGTVVDERGEPVAGMTVFQSDRARIADRELAELTFHARARSAPTGADGAFALTLPLADATFALRAFGRRGERVLQSAEFVLGPDDAGEELRLVVEPPAEGK